jgi:hypothetical protein
MLLGFGRLPDPEADAAAATAYTDDLDGAAEPDPAALDPVVVEPTDQKLTRTE